MKNHVLSSLVSVLFFGFATAAWADYTEESRQLLADETLQVDGTLTVASGVTVDLNGYKLTYTGVRALSGTGKITDTVGRGVLEIEVEKGQTVQNGGSDAIKVALSGQLRLVKSGEGILNIAGSKLGSHDYTGGTEVRGGTLTADKYAAMSGETTQFGKNAVIDVYSGSKIDLASPDHNKTTVNLYAGEITGPIKTKFSDGKQCAAKINLEADSTLKPTKQFGISGPINLKGHTLTISLQDKLEWKPSSITIGTILICKGTLTVVGNVSDSSANLTMTDTAGLSLGAYEYVVNDYIANSTGSLSGTGALQVSGTFTPTSDNFYPCTMMDGSTIDLSTKETTWSLSNAAGAAAQFAAGATVTIDVGVREIAAGDKIVEWSEGTEYAGREFVLKTNGATSEDFELQVSATGLTVAARGAKVPTATWTGAVSADAANPDNWSWANVPEPTPGLTPGGSLNLTPGPTTAVVIPWDKLATISWPDTTDLSFATIEFAGEKPTETVVIDGDRDWRGLGPMDIPFALDLNGHKLYLVLPGAASVNKTEVTSSVEGGELHATVATDKVHDNTSVALTGNLTLIKEGPGAFVATKHPQTYTGETVVNEGTLRAADSANVNKDSTASVTNSPFGGSRVITVGPEGVLDPRGSSAWGYHTINLNGGAITNTVAKRGVGTTAYNVAANNYPEPFNPTINLLADSTFATTKEFNFNGKIVSDGHDLEIWIASGQSLLWVPNAAEKAVFNVTNGGYLKTLKNHTFNQKTATLKFTGGTMDLAGDLVVSNYYVATAVKDYQYDTRAELKMTVAGVFTPVTQNFFGCQLLDGATIDLGNLETSWSSHSALVNSHKSTMGQGDCLDVTFADGATVTIDVGEREFKGVEQIVTWSEGSKASAATATFVLNAAAKAKGYRLVRDENGLSVGRKGLVLLFQ